MNKNWKSPEEIASAIKLLDDNSGISSAYPLSCFWDTAIYTEGYTASEDWVSAVVLSPYGEEIIAEFGSTLHDIGEADRRLALFGKFFHHDLLIDTKQTKTDVVKRILNDELLSGRISLPHRFGRVLYDRFNDLYLGQRISNLMVADVDKLLDGMPIGVYQVGRLVSGPLGIIESRGRRNLPPTLILPLWHCSDSGCQALHEVSLRQRAVPSVEADARLQNSLSRRYGPASPWHLALSFVIRGDRGRKFVDLPALIADCIIGNELKTLVTIALTGEHGPHLRDVLRGLSKRKRDGDGSALDVASRLSAEARLQLLLSLDDKELVALIDDAVISKRIRIPLGEVREITYQVPKFVRDSQSKLSSLGIRSTRRNSIVNLTSSILNTYDNLRITKELEWRFRSDGSKSAYDSLVELIRKRGPAECVRDLILSSAAVTKDVCEAHDIALIHASGTGDASVDRLLWKLGFDPMQFDEAIQRYRTRLKEFNETILNQSPIDNEDARDRIRAAGVNVFVSLEEFLDRLISYNVWMLSSDHFLGTSFYFSLLDARQSVTKVIGESLTSGDSSTRWIDSGENSLGTLMRYLRATSEWIQQLPSMNRDQTQRDATDLPHFSDDPGAAYFPFKHESLWADSDPEELRKYGDAFARIVKLVEECQPASIRNDLDHYREPDRFPSADRLLACVVRLHQALDMADLQRFFPKVYWMLGERRTRFGTAEFEFLDYAGRSVAIYGPDLVSGLPKIEYGDACVLASGNILGAPNSALIFKLRESSEFSRYWREYPRRAHSSSEALIDEISNTPPPERAPNDSSGGSRDGSTPRNAMSGNPPSGQSIPV